MIGKCRFFIAALLLAGLLVGCGKTETAAPENTAAATEVTNAPTEAEVIETTMPVANVNEALSNVWDIMDNACVEEIPILPGLLIDDIEDWMKETEFKEIKLYQRTDWNTVRLGVYGDVAVAQISMVGDKVTEVEDFAWNVRMEKSDTHENKTGIVVPDYAQTDEWVNYNPAVPVKWYHWSNNDGTWTEMYIVYFEETQNLYTFYSNQLVYEHTGDEPTYETITYRNSQRSPDAVLYYIEDDGDDYYDYPDTEALAAARNTNDIRYFRIKTAGETKTYQYRFGTKVAEWVNSPYNTDGWKMVPDDPDTIISADGRYELPGYAYIWRTMSASSH